jgi:uncharacterized membrane protein
MSASEVADNKWEASAAKPPITTIPSIAQILMMVGFALFFAWVLIFSLIGAFGPNKGGDLEERYKHMNDAPEGAAPEG